MFLLPHSAGVNQTHGWRRNQRGRWQNKKRKGKLSFSTCQSRGCQSVTRILTIIGCHHSVIRTASGETVGRRAEDWQSSPSSPYSTAGRVTFVIYTHTHTRQQVGRQQIKHVRRAMCHPEWVLQTYWGAGSLEECFVLTNVSCRNLSVNVFLNCMLCVWFCLSSFVCFVFKNV